MCYVRAKEAISLFDLCHWGKTIPLWKFVSGKLSRWDNAKIQHHNVSGFFLSFVIYLLSFARVKFQFQRSMLVSSSIRFLSVILTNCKCLTVFHRKVYQVAVSTTQEVSAYYKHTEKYLNKLI